MNRALFRRGVGEVLAVEQDGAAIGLVEAGDYPEQRRFAASDGPSKVKNSPLSMAMLTLSTAVRVPKRRVTLRISRSAMKAVARRRTRAF
jgi:hypothetical protein